jgi:hypothetical protein
VESKALQAMIIPWEVSQIAEPTAGCLFNKINNSTICVTP